MRVQCYGCFKKYTGTGLSFTVDDFAHIVKCISRNSKNQPSDSCLLSIVYGPFQNGKHIWQINKCLSCNCCIHAFYKSQ